ncbi:MULTISPECIES: hypothetical protein [unclassified Arthrobacter]|uniref:hypothetical protein n=1 Tax=unclassified Arthrobacter TaxID=235627 RepID=UPI0011B0C6F2|nr:MULTISPECIES: hypothetical protein [unclassified Arthrobacter]
MLAIAVAFTYAVFAGFMVTLLSDEVTIPDATQLRVSGDTSTTNGAGLPALVHDVANSTDAVIVRESIDLHDPSLRHFFVELGDSESTVASWFEDGYPGFSAGQSTQIHDASELLGVDPRGTYYTLGPSEAAEKVARTFTDLGYTVEQHEAGSIAVFLLEGPFAFSTLIAALLVALLVGIAVTTNVKSYAIQKLHGAQKRHAILRDLKDVLMGVLLFVLLVLVATIVWLWFYNSLNQLGNMMRATGRIFAVALMLTLFIHSATLAVVWDQKILQGVKGKLGFKIAVPAAYLVRVPGLLLAVSTCAAVVVSAGALANAADARSSMNAAGSAATIRFEGNNPAGTERLAIASGAWLKEEDAAGRTILALPETLDDDKATAYELLLVNNTYLQLNSVLDPSGQQIAPVDAGQVKAYLPEGSSMTQTEINDFLGLSAGNHSKQNVHLEFSGLKTGQSHFLYEPHPDGSQYPSELTDSVVIVVHPESGFMSDDDYMAAASRGRVLVTDAEVAAENTPDEFLGSWIAAYTPVAQSAASEYSLRISDLRTTVALALVSLMVLLATAVGMAQIHVRGNAQTILVRYLHGWKFFTTHSWLLRAEAIMFGAVCCWAAVRWLYSFISQHSGSAPAANHGTNNALLVWEPWILLALAVINLGVLVGLVHLRTLSMIRTRSEETA